MPHPTPARRIEIDLLRSLAIAAMIVYHLLYDLESYYGRNIGIFSPAWTVFERVTAGLFLLLAGISFALSRKRNRDLSPGDRRRKYLRRGLGLLACGMLISLVTILYDPVSYVRFGILHLIGASALILPAFSRFGSWNVLPAIVMIIMGLMLHDMTGSGLLLPLGIRPANFMSVDYFPLLPWMGVILLGFVLGERLYAGKPAPLLPNENRLLKTLAWPGKYSLLIYLIHQPLILLVLWILL